MYPYDRMYEGRLVGAGPAVFAVVQYALGHQMLHGKDMGTVLLNPQILCPMLGCPADAMEEAIEYLCRPNIACLVQLSDFSYRVNEHNIFELSEEPPELVTPAAVANCTLAGEEA